MDFSETVKVCDVVIGIYNQLIEHMKTEGYQKPLSLFGLCPRSLKFQNPNKFFSESTQPVEAKIYLAVLQNREMEIYQK